MWLAKPKGLSRTSMLLHPGRCTQKTTRAHMGPVCRNQLQPLNIQLIRPKCRVSTTGLRSDARSADAAASGGAGGGEMCHGGQTRELRG